MKHEKSCGCVIVNDEKVLLIQQTKGHWGFPKGHVENNETEIETAIREVKEETNIDVEIMPQYRFATEYIMNEQTKKEVVYFMARTSGGELRKQEKEIQNIEWLKFDNALERITYDDTRKILQEVIQIWRQQEK